MTNPSAHASVYTDFQGLAELKAAAGRQSPEAMREAARQFEALFVQTMLKAMRDASPGDGLFDSNQAGFYRDMYDRQLALEMVKGRGIGIADMLVRDMGGEPPQQAVPLRQDIVRSQLPVLAPPDGAVPVIDLDAPATPLIGEAYAAIQAGEEAQQAKHDWQPRDPRSFIRELLPHARKGAAELGVTPGVLVAQAALETGWGQKMIRHPDGRNSFNLFGIKADARWDGDRAIVSTLEYAGGVARRERAAFRAYDSLDAAVAGYVDFIRTNPRYTQAIENAENPAAYLQALKDAGYATDPDYVEKIRSIMDTHSFDLATDRLVLSGADPGTAGL